MRNIFIGLILSTSVTAFAQTASVAVKLKPAGSFTGKSSQVTGFATMKGANVEAKNIVVDLRKIETGIGVRDEHTRKHLEVEKYPTATLVSATGSNGQGTGVINIRGIQKSVAGTYKVEGANLVAEFPLKLSDFKITGIKYMGVGVDDEVKINVSVPIKK